MIFITPSYRPDLERLLCQRESIRRYCTEPVRHLVVVPKADRRIFTKRFAGDPLVEVLVQNDFVDRRFYPKWGYRYINYLAPSQSWRFSQIAGRSGWIIQQIAKLSALSMTDESPLVITDSDSIFFRPFGASDFLAPFGRRILIRRTSQSDESPHQKHVINSRRLLQLPEGALGMNYMSVPMVWHRDWLQALHHYLENLYLRPWQHTLVQQTMISEYTLYGLFVDEVLIPESLSVRPQPYNFGLWKPEELATLPAHLDKIRSLASADAAESAVSPICFTLQSWLGLPPDEYRKILDVAGGG